MSASGTPHRPARGLPLEQALEHWSDPAVYAGMREYWAHRGSPFFIGTGPPTPGEEEYGRRRRPLEKRFLERLQLGELFATAVPEDADPTAARTLIDPEVFWHADLIFETDALADPGPRLSYVEIFEPPEVPRNVRIIPGWYREQYEVVPAAAPSSSLIATDPSGEAGFRQEADYRRVWIDGTKFELAGLQVKVVKILHRAHLAGDPWRSGKKVLQEAGSSSTQMVHIFRRHAKPHWRLLIESDSRGNYRLNIRE